MSLLNNNPAFLPYLLTEDIYIINEQKAIINDNENIKDAGIQQPSVIEYIKQTEEKIPLIEKSTFKKVKKKIIVLLGYQGITSVPENVTEALSKIFDALKVNNEEVELINILSPEAPNIESYEFTFLILMGGNGKNLLFLKNYLNERNKYDIINHDGKTVFFAEAMDVYFTNIELKRKFWNKLKELFEVN